MATDNDVLELRKWLAELWPKVRQLRLDHDIFTEVQEMIARNPALHHSSHFYEWLRNMYVSGMTMSIRRLMDDDKRTRSLLQFLLRVRSDRGVVSRERYRQLYLARNNYSEGYMSRYVEDTYDAYVGTSHTEPPIQQVQGQIDELHKRTHLFIELGNKVIGHSDVTPPSTVPRFAEVGDVIYSMEKILQYYNQLLTAAHRSADINWQYDWKAIFRVAWIP
jgi:hypothetical protein